MCTGGCAKCLGTVLIPLAVLCTLANILLFFPGGKVAQENEHITDEVWYFGGILGSGVLMIFPALVFLGLQNNDCCGCCGNRSCGKRFASIMVLFSHFVLAVLKVTLAVGHYIPNSPQTSTVATRASEFKQGIGFCMIYLHMFSSIIFAAVGVLGAGYCFILSAVALNKGPKCNTGSSWNYPFKDGDYLTDHGLWNKCLSPENIVVWHLTLFSLLLVMSLVQGVLCGIQVVNGLFGTLCGDCKCCGCCGGDGTV